MKDALPSAWRQTTLGEVAAPVPNAIVDGPFGSNLKLSDYVDQGVPVLQGKNVTNDCFRWFDIRFISATKAAELKRSSVRVGDILIVKIGSIGYSAIVDDLNGFDFAIIPANLAKITPDVTKIDSVYLHRWLTSDYAKQYFVRAASKTAQPALSLEKIKKLPVPLPSLSEQHRIAEILDKADALRAKRRAALEQLDSLTQSIFLDMFGDPAINPKDWPIQSLSDVSIKITDGEHQTPKRSLEGIKLLSARNIQNGYIDVSNVDYVSLEEHERIRRRCNPMRGDILISCSGTIGRVATIDTDEPFSLVRSVAIVKLHRDRAESKFLEYYLRTPALNEKMHKSANASSQANLFQNQIQKLPVFVPPIALQRNFIQQLEKVEKLRAAYRSSLSELAALFASLQHQAFNGKL